MEITFSQLIYRNLKSLLSEKAVTFVQVAQKVEGREQKYNLVQLL